MSASLGATPQFERHHVEGSEGELRRATYEVFEDRKAKSGRRISLHILVLRALEAEKQADPLFILADGPGQAATFTFRFVAQVRRTRDTVTGEGPSLILSTKKRSNWSCRHLARR